jgi:hypothetical protein
VDGCIGGHDGGGSDVGLAVGNRCGVEWLSKN